jgi:hypothetical protein
LAGDGSLRVSDFGIARAAGLDTLTAVGDVLGSSGYMAPEQARGEESTAATDRYALACVGFELLTGRRPFERESHAAEAAAHATETPPSVAELDPSLPLGLDQVFARGLAKVPELRHGSAGELVAELRRVLTEPEEATLVTSAPAPPSLTRYAAPPRRVPLILVAAALVTLGVLVGWAVAHVGDGSDLARSLAVRTVQRTVTVEPAPPPAAPAPPAPTGSPSELNDEAFRLLQAGDARSALPLLESAVYQLRGDGSRTEAYASYNLAWARLALGRCSGVLELLDRSEAVQGFRAEIQRLRRDAERRCDENGEGKGKKKGKKD